MAPRAPTLLMAATIVACAPAPPGGPDRGASAIAADRARVVFGADTLLVEVARTDEQRARGLMFRDSLPDGSGMLFVFPAAEVQGVWMKDTPVALDAAFLDAERRISSIEPLEPFDETVRYSEGPILYVLEVPRGWFERSGVSVGDRASIEAVAP